MSSQAADLAHEASFTIGCVTVQPALCTVRGPDQTALKLEPRVMQVLVVLAGARGTLLSRSDLRAACWDGRVTSDDAIDRVIAQLRRLGSSVGADSFTVETIPKVGYRLVEQAAPHPARTAPASTSRRWFLGGAIIAPAAVAIGASVAFRKFMPVQSAVGDGPVTVAVLPFTSDLPSASTKTFAVGLADQVRANLSRLVDIRVIARTSSATAAAETGAAQQLGRSLGARYLIEGQVSGADGQLLTSVALVDAQSGAQLWTAQESAPQDNSAGLSAAVSGDVIQLLAGIIPMAAQPRVPVRRPDPEAYAMVQRATQLLEGVRTSQMRGKEAEGLAAGLVASQLAERALAIDPNYSGALAVLASITRHGWTPALAHQHLTSRQRVQASIALVRRALLADPRDPAPLTELGDYDRRYEFRWDEAENLFRRALAVDPSFVEAHWSYAYQLATLGRAVEGLDHALSVFELDPRNPFRRVALPRLLYNVGQRAAAMRRYDAELAAQPDNLFLLRELYFMFLSEGSAADLQRLGDRLRRPAATPELSALAARAAAGRLALEGKPEQLRLLIAQEVHEFDSGDAWSNATPQGRAREDLPYIFAIEYAWAGLPDRALDMLERALSAKSLYWPPTLPFGLAPFPSSTCNDPRFRALWLRDPGLIDLVARRRAALVAGTMAGVADNGRMVIPRLPAALVARVKRALASAA